MTLTMKHAGCMAMLLGLLVCDAAPQAKLATKPVLTLEVAKEIALAAGQFAKKNQWNAAIAIVDDGGHLLYFERMDNVQTGSIEVAIQKAKTAMAFKRPSRLFKEAVAQGRTVLVRLPGAIPFEGGVPIRVNDQVIGAIGISGMSAQQDGMIAEAGVDALPKILGR